MMTPTSPGFYFWLSGGLLAAGVLAYLLFGLIKALVLITAEKEF
ncbi:MULTISPECIES: hypothetical protein [unclassified Neisseria]|nr:MULTISPECIES: hypothetical protein [unclassified Neisseria]MDO1510467.1 hypothetical protein [Neisseria sp. MVDL19-042950]MDO1516636.1 hypothetical protein [Neisseria sp. MVDL18-041461]MDO1563782.1 hypothetical protein [Neisseria sp. MVDL20-010259]